MLSTLLDPARSKGCSGGIRTGWLPLLGCAVLVSVLGSPLSGQSHLGKDFWLADLYSTAVGFTIAIGNPGSVTANVTLFNVIDGPTLDTVAPGAVKTYTFADHELAIQGAAISPDPVWHVTSDVDVAVFAFDPLANAAFNDASSCCPSRPWASGTGSRTTSTRTTARGASSAWSRSRASPASRSSTTRRP